MIIMLPGIVSAFSFYIIKAVHSHIPSRLQNPHIKPQTTPFPFCQLFRRAGVAALRPALFG
jgi:hypothetical protein